MYMVVRAHKAQTIELYYLIFCTECPTTDHDSVVVVGVEEVL